MYLCQVVQINLLRSCNEINCINDSVLFSLYFILFYYKACHILYQYDYSIPTDFPKDIFLSELLNRHALGDEQPYQAVMSLVLEALPRSVQVSEIDLSVAKI